MSQIISVLGSTGSIGTQTLDVAAQCGFQVAAITANRSTDKLEKQARRFRPELVAAYDESAAAELRIRLADTGIRLRYGGPDRSGHASQRGYRRDRRHGYDRSAPHAGRH